MRISLKKKKALLALQSMQISCNTIKKTVAFKRDGGAVMIQKTKVVNSLL